jgi:hypothetical protein
MNNTTNPSTTPGSVNGVPPDRSGRVPQPAVLRPSQPADGKGSPLVRRLLQDRVYSLAITIVLICVVASLVFPQTFPTFENFSQILLNLSIDTIVAVGMMVLLIAGMFDLSVGSWWRLRGADGQPDVLPRRAGAGCHRGRAAQCGAGRLDQRLPDRLPGHQPHDPDAGHARHLRGGALLVAGAGIQNLPYWFNAIGQSRLLGIQMPVWYMLLTVAAVRLPGAQNGVFSAVLLHWRQRQGRLSCRASG